MLGTPPAFILSQDRTLTFKCISSPKWLDRSSDQNLSLAFLLSVLPLVRLFCSLKFLFGIFRVALLFHCQCALSWLVSRNSDRISYRSLSVNNFFNFFINFKSLILVQDHCWSCPLFTSLHTPGWLYVSCSLNYSNRIFQGCITVYLSKCSGFVYSSLNTCL